MLAQRWFTVGPRSTTVANISCVLCFTFLSWRPLLSRPVSSVGWGRWVCLRVVLSLERRIEWWFHCQTCSGCSPSAGGLESHSPAPARTHNTKHILQCQFYKMNCSTRQCTSPTPATHCIAWGLLCMGFALHYIASQCMGFALHYIALHYIALHCNTFNCAALRCIALHCIALHCIALHCITLHRNAWDLHCITLHCITLHCIEIHSIALSCVELHCIALHCIALHCIAFYTFHYIHFVTWHIIFMGFPVLFFRLCKRYSAAIQVFPWTGDYRPLIIKCYILRPPILTNGFVDVFRLIGLHLRVSKQSYVTPVLVLWTRLRKASTLYVYDYTRPTWQLWVIWLER